jgi:hypothetical protein
MQEAWQTTMQDANLDVFSHPRQLFERIDADPNFLGSLDALVVDMHFNGNDETGVDVARFVREQRRYDGPIFLSSDSRDTFSGLAQLGVTRLDKEPLSWGDLCTHMPVAAERPPS